MRLVTVVVNLRVAVKQLKHMEPFDAHDIFVAKSPEKIGVIQNGVATGGDGPVHVALHTASLRYVAKFPIH